jgi:hypothetical protein
VAISRIGSTASSNSGTGSSTVTFSTGLLDDSNVAIGAGVIQQNDIVLVCYICSALVDMAQSALTPSGYTTVHTDLYSDDSFDTNMQVSYKVMGSTPDTTVTIPGGNASTNGYCYHVIVLRGVNNATPMDVTPTTATGINAAQPNPAAITPVTQGAWIIAFGGAACSAASTSSLTFSPNMSSAVGADRGAIIGTPATQQCVSRYSTLTTWTSGAFDPTVFGGGNATNTSSWAAVTIAVRPACSPPPFLFSSVYMPFLAR